MGWLMPPASRLGVFRLPVSREMNEVHLVDEIYQQPVRAAETFTGIPPASA